MDKWIIKILDNPDDIGEIEDLQRLVWPGSDIDVVPAHVIITLAHNGGIVIGAYAGDRLIGFVYGFLGFSTTQEGHQLKHCSHQLGVHPDYRGQGIGFAIKRAQWQMVRSQGLDLITWTYDPLLSGNAYLNIAKLGAVCNSYLKEWYGQMRDGLNIGLPSDRFQVNMWVNSKRVQSRLSNHPRRKLDLAHYLGAGAEIINPTSLGTSGLPAPPTSTLFQLRNELTPLSQDTDGESEYHRDITQAVLLIEIPPDFLALKELDFDLAKSWRIHSRVLFENLFSLGYLVTDFIFLPGKQPRSFYVLSHGEQTL
ncbi:MAG: GNAT family N-acetyltransferase [Anaerolineales bacterium]|jgi:predicted GNAT superfamily acetyltransferase